MDSEAGGMASPILPDGTLLSLPIPDENSKQHYETFIYKEHSFGEIIHQLNPRFNFDKNFSCHLDPDIYDNIEGKPKEWKAAFGQSGVSARHLDKMQVGIGDIFLFYGMFRETIQQADGTLSYAPGSPVRHIIYGYMEVGEILKRQQDIEERYSWHPHSSGEGRSYNRLYLPKQYGTFQYDDSLVLTKPEQNSRRMWRLPVFFAENGISISWQGNNRPIYKDGYAELNSSCRGQEFVITTSTVEQEENLRNWIDSIIQAGKGNMDKTNLSTVHQSVPKTVMLNHFNYLDEYGNVFCKRLNKIHTVAPEYKECGNCPYLFGSLQGQGVECRWEDVPSESPCGLYVKDPQKELARVSRLVKEKVIENS